MSSRCGRAELLRILSAQGNDLLDAAAAWLGYERETPQFTKDVGDVPGSRRLSVVGTTLEITPGQETLAHVPKPRARLLHPVAVSHFDAPTLVTERTLEPPWEGSDRGDILALPESQPLVPWPRLWRRLRRHLSQFLITQELDVPALLDQVTRVEPLRKLPRLVRARFAAKVIILVDRTRRQLPFWSDQDLVCRALARWTLSDQQRPLLFCDGEDPHELLKSGSIEFAGGVNGCLVLLLGDLGAYGTSDQCEAWRCAGQWLKDHGAELRALAPCPGWRLEPSIAALWNAVAWDEAEARLPILSESELRERADRLLDVVSAALRIEPGLLRDARALLPVEATDSGTEADVVAHPAVTGKSALALTLAEEALEHHRDRFQQSLPELERQLPGIVRKLLGHLQHWHQGLPPEILMLECFELWQRHPELFLDEEGKALVDWVRKGMLAALEAIYQQDLAPDRTVPEPVLAWFRDFESRIPEEAWPRDKELRQPLLRAWAVAHRGEAQPKLPPGADSETLAILTRGKAPPPRRYRIWQVGAGLLVLSGDPTFDGGPPRPRPGTDALPVGSPLADIIAGATELVVAAPGQPTTTHEIPTPLERPIALPEWDHPAQRLSIVSDRQQLTLEVLEMPAWAKRVGRDAYGLYVEFEFKGVWEKMRWIAPGRFMMGSPESEAKRNDDEVQHEVELTEGYWMADTACPQALWEAVMGSNPSHFKSYHGHPTPNLPVDSVSWDDCNAFLKRINETVSGLELRLPTEAEWEYACRAGTETPFSFGESITPEQVNFGGRHISIGAEKGEYRAAPVAVGSLPPNPWGLYELHGNVWEWCADRYGDYSREKAVDPSGPSEGQSRVLRGGSWDRSVWYVRSARRSYDDPGVRNGLFGFRFVRGRKTEGQPESGAARVRTKPGAKR